MSFSSSNAPNGRRDEAGKPQLWFVAALPPPLNGQSNCNRAMLDELTARGVSIGVYDIGGTIKTKVRGVWRATLAVLTTGTSSDRAYLSAPGQAGVLLFVLLAFALRLRGIAHVVHHHSFRPINLGPLRAMRLLVAAGGRYQRHVLLSADMKRRFAGLYLEGDAHRAMTLSNAYLFGPRLGMALRPHRRVTLGHMSVLTNEKGVGYLLHLFDALITRGHDWRLVIAGPCADAALRQELADACAAHPDRIEYRGLVDGAEKERFFADIDLFVLPTTLVDEAEPLVMLEAFGRGVDVVANDTGCIRDRIRTPSHLLTREREADKVLIEARVADNALDWGEARRRCVDHARAIKEQADGDAAAFFPQMLHTAGVFAIAAGHVT